MRYRAGWFICLILVCACIAASAVEIGVNLYVSSSLLPSEDAPTFSTNISLYAQSQGDRWTGRIAVGSPIKRWRPGLSVGGEYSLGSGFGLSASLALSEASGYTHIFLSLAGQYTVLDDEFTIEIGGGGLGITAMRSDGVWTSAVALTPGISLEAGWTSSGDIRFHEHLSLTLGFLPTRIDPELTVLKRRYIITAGSTTGIEFTLP